MLRLAGVLAVLALVVHVAGCCCCGPGIPTNTGGVGVSAPERLREIPAPTMQASAMRP